MKPNKSKCLFMSWQFHISVLLMLTWLSQVSALSQSSTSSQASVRGTAKIEGTFPVNGIMVVVIHPGVDGGPTGKPVPAWVDNEGDYRIEDISPGSYDLKAIGRPIKTKVLRGITIREGNSNIFNIELERAEKRTHVHCKVIDAQGNALRNTRVAIYSSELPSSMCDKCMLAEALSDERGEVDYSDIVSQQSYNLAVKITDGAAPHTVALVSTELIIGQESEDQIELRVGEGSHPVLTATVLPSSNLSTPEQKQLNQSANAVNLKPDRSITRSVASGQRMRINGVVVRRDADTFTIRDANGADTTVAMTDRTNVQTKGGFLRSGKNYAATNILRGLNLEVEGRGDSSGNLAAEKVRFTVSDLMVARSIESRVDPVENRVGTAENRIGQVEQNAQRLSGQIDDLAAVSNAAKGGSRAAQETADAAVAGVNATNDRISALDDYVPQENAAINFKVGSATLLPDGKAQLDTIASKALNAKGYVIEVLGYTDASGSIEANRRLSQRRADAVVRYLVENHNIPIRRIITPYGIGEAQAVADNKSRQGRAQNRRVEVKILVNRGMTPGTSP